MDTKTLLDLKKIIEGKLSDSKQNMFGMTQSEADASFGKEMAYDEILDLINDRLEESKNSL